MLERSGPEPPADPQPEPSPAPDGPEAEAAPEPEAEEAPADLDPSALTPAALEAMSVVKLRAAARTLGVTSMTRKEIRFAKKEELVTALTAWLEQR